MNRRAISGRYRSIKLLPKGSHGAGQNFIPIATNKTIQQKNHELLEPRVMHGWILGFSSKVQKIREGTGLPTSQIPEAKRPCNSLTLFQESCLSEDKVLIRQMSKTLKNQTQVPFRLLNLSQWTSLLEATEHPAKDMTGHKIDTSQRQNMVKGSMITLNHTNR